MDNSIVLIEASAGLTGIVILVDFCELVALLVATPLLPLLFVMLGLPVCAVVGADDVP